MTILPAELPISANVKRIEQPVLSDETRPSALLEFERDEWAVRWANEAFYLFTRKAMSDLVQDLTFGEITRGNLSDGFCDVPKLRSLLSGSTGWQSLELPSHVGGSMIAELWFLVGGIDQEPGVRSNTVQTNTLSMKQMRAIVGSSLTEWGVEAQSDILLVVSELISNALLHGNGSLTMRYSLSVDSLRVEVDDKSSAVPRKLRGHSDRAGGYGISIIDDIAKWGWKQQLGGKTVWAEVPVCHRGR